MFAHRSHRQVEMTAGPLLPNVLAFTVPLILSGVLQLLYNSADIIVVGRFADSVAMASVGASVAVARATGAGDRDGVRCAVHTSMAL
ncbi:MAG: MATE family efflux transporter, partial [Clostridiales bacterium]|nr:MATE family efflux transporter [Clostridiales bacterium]